jgi:hypothetical protein
MPSLRAMDRGKLSRDGQTGGTLHHPPAATATAQLLDDFKESGITQPSSEAHLSPVMPSRPPPVPSRMLQPLQLEKPVLSPISDRSFLAAADATVSPPLDASEEEFIMAQSSLTVDTAMRGRSARVWLHPTPSEERLGRGPDAGPRKVERVPPEESAKTDVLTSSGPSASQVENKAFNMDRRPSNASEAFVAEDAPITEDDRSIARQIFDGDESFVAKAAAASWLGQSNAAKARTAYMECFDWTGLNILSAFRELCGRLVVRAESQQLDRVIDAFSERWCECNPNHGFKDRGKFALDINLS